MKKLSVLIYVLLIAVILIAVNSDQGALTRTPPKTNCDSSCPWPQHAQVMSQENWAFTLPNAGWMSLDVPVPEIKVMLKNEPKECRVILIKEYTSESYVKYVIGTIRTLEDGGLLSRSISQVVVNGNKFILAQAHKNGAIVWNWLTVKDGFGYSFSCIAEGGPDAGKETQELCQSIADTLVIK